MKFNILKDIVSQSSYFQSPPDPLTLGGVGGGNLRSWKTLKSGEIGIKLGGKIKTSPRYVIDIAGTDLLPLGSWGDSE